MTWINEATASVAIILWVLVARGFWPHLRFRGDGPLHYMVQGVSLVSAIVVVRLSYWDLARPAARALGWIPPIDPAWSLTILNGAFNAAAAVAAWLILVGFHATLPDDERRFYTPLTAPFYPRGILFFRKEKV